MIDHNDKHHDHDHDKHHDLQPGRASAAIFLSKAEAREAIAELHKAHFTHTWLGVTSLAATDSGEQTLTVEPGAPSFFSGAQSLVDALVSHGVLGDAARSIESTIEPGEAIVTVDPKDKDADDAIAILERHGGHVVGSVRRERSTLLTPGATGTATTGVATTAATATAIDDAGEETFYRRGPLGA